QYTVTVTDQAGAPLAERPVYLAVTEPQTQLDVTQTKLTDAQGQVAGSYLVQEPGIIGLAAATLRHPADPALRVGDERFLVVRQMAEPPHMPSPWESGIPMPLAELLRHRPPAFRLADKGTESVIDYEKYGQFHDRGTAHYRYEVTDIDGLSAAAGEGIYPNEASLIRDPAFRAMRDSGALAGSHWDFTFVKSAQQAFFKWASADEEPGVKLFYTALTLERAGLWRHAAKAFHAVTVHFPASVGWTAFAPPTPWYVAKVARDKLLAILRLHPEIGLRLEGSSFEMDGGFDSNPSNDVIRVDPGRFVRVQPEAVNPRSAEVAGLPITRRVGQGTVRLVQYQNGHWQLLVDGKPWVIRGMTYQPSAVGESPDEGSLKDWMQADRNGNGQ
ncbi:MAG: Ig-like domain-containing protein, partial [Dehalococcoidia bacterium]|nr:Ig-like domain-containing protein [Dehalococcoidia bacterium]